MAGQGPLTNRVLGNTYILGDLLGQGGFGAVYQAQHQRLNRPQAIKVLTEQHFSNPQFRARFIREAQTLASLDHPNILHVDELGEEGALIYLVMPYIARGTFQALLKQQGPLGVDEAGRYLEQICMGLRYAHKRGVIHLDIKPLNLLVHEDGRLLLSDFGLAHLIKEGAVEGGSSLSFGTPLYMAPEHLRGQPDWRSDLYSVGVILYQMLTGRLPFEGPTPEAIIMKLLTERAPPLRGLRPDLPVSLEWMLAKALSKRPEERYQKASEFLYYFRDALSPRPSGMIGAPPAPRPSAPVPRPTAPIVPAPAQPVPRPGVPVGNYAPMVAPNRPLYQAPYPAASPAKQAFWKQGTSRKVAIIGSAMVLLAYFLPWFDTNTGSASGISLLGENSNAIRGEVIATAALLCCSLIAVSGRLNAMKERIVYRVILVTAFLGFAGVLFLAVKAFTSPDYLDLGGPAIATGGLLVMGLGFLGGLVGAALGLGELARA